jgi:hypothetical protein
MICFQTKARKLAFCFFSKNKSRLLSCSAYILSACITLNLLSDAAERSIAFAEQLPNNYFEKNIQLRI